MIFSCPECEKKYILSASALGQDGKTVRCANCFHEWFQEPEQQPYQEPEEEVDEYEDEPYEEELPEEVEEEYDELDERIGAFLEDEPEEEPQMVEEPEDGEQPLEDLIEELSRRGQESEEDKYISENVDEDLPIPQGVKPRHEEEDEEAPPKKAKQKKQKRERVEEPIVARMMGMMAAMFVFACIVLSGILAKPQIVAAWPPSAAIYDLAGLPVMVEGEGLIIESLSTELSTDGRKLLLEGSIVNLKDKTVRIPQMRASFKITDNSGKPWIIEPPQDEVAAKDTVKFSSTYQYPPEDVTMLNVTFDTKMK